MPMKFSFSPSGGALYHLIAFRRARTSWKSFAAQVRAWILAWRSETTRELIVFGPSAGWTLPLDLLARAKTLTVVEPDPLARALLKRRLPAHARVEWIASARVLPWFSENEFENFLAERPHADILFANVLGQVPLHFSRAQKVKAAAANRRFLDALRGRRWASYHDVYSGPRPAATASLKAQAPGDALAAHVFTHGEITDHETCWLSEGRETELALWPLTESQTHLIAFVSSSTPADARL